MGDFISAEFMGYFISDEFMSYFVSAVYGWFCFCRLWMIFISAVHG